MTQAASSLLRPGGEERADIGLPEAAVTTRRADARQLPRRRHLLTVFAYLPHGGDPPEAISGPFPLQATSLLPS